MSANEERNWYIVNTYSGRENKVKANIEMRIESMNMQDYIFQVLVVEYPEPVRKNGELTGKFKNKNLYPGYLFIDMIMTDEAWYVVRNTPGVTGFIGSSGKGVKPFPVTSEMESVLKRAGLLQNGSASDYQVGETIKVVSGPFANNVSTIDSIDEEKGLVKITTLVFGRDTQIELSVNDIEKYK